MERMSELITPEDWFFTLLIVHAGSRPLELFKV
jgi:hypothetical protein